MNPKIVLLSHHGCPYVQRVAIVLSEKGIEHERRDIDLHEKPDWFLRVSPLGLIPVLLVDDEPIFESRVICEYLDETCGTPLLSLHPLTRAQQRAWMEFGSGLLQSVGGFFKATDESTMQARRTEMIQRLATLEHTLGEGPYFDGPVFGMVDVIFAPVFRYFDAFALMDSHDYFGAIPKVAAWKSQLAQRPSVQAAVKPDFLPNLVIYLGSRQSAFARASRHHAALLSTAAGQATQ